MMVVNFVRVKL